MFNLNIIQNKIKFIHNTAMERHIHTLCDTCRVINQAKHVKRLVSQPSLPLETVRGLLTYLTDGAAVYHEDHWTIKMERVRLDIYDELLKVLGKPPKNNSPPSVKSFRDAVRVLSRDVVHCGCNILEDPYDVTIYLSELSDRKKNYIQLILSFGV